MRVVPTFTEEHDKVRALNGANDVIGEFIEWLPQHKFWICDEGGEDGFFPIYRSITSSLAEYFDIDERGYAHEKEMTYRYIRWVREQEGD